ncbi:hypothetical protein [Streptomyces sp. NPDC059861]|uniref:hypothetical protein n=1 Tax=Streptomyces sp. NPDC059861 TaxID=3346974 RepID=UPI00364BEB32
MHSGDVFVGEVAGTAILILLGAGANPLVTLGTHPNTQSIAVPPIPDRGTSDRGHAWIPVVGPLVGVTLAGLIHASAF